MGSFFGAISDKHQAFIEHQSMFFVATAANEGHVNVSPKGLDSFKVLGPNKVCYLDLTGSGVETIAHLQEDGRITIMFCAFDGPPNIVRLLGTGSVVKLGEKGFEELAEMFPEYPGARAVITIDVEKVGSSCGFGVPLMEVVGQRDRMVEYAENKGEQGMAEYRVTKNAESIDGLPGY